MGAELIAWSFTSGWASGVNAYAVVLVMGLLGRFGGVEAVPSVLERPDVMFAAGVFFVLEMFADKIPYLDSVWDAVHLAIRPVIGATVGYLLAHESSSVDAALLAATGGITALLSHLTKAGLRLGVNTSPEPVSNIAISTAEDVTVAGVITMLAAQPFLAAGIAAALLIGGGVLALWLLRRVRRFKRRYDDWGGPSNAQRRLREAEHESDAIRE